MILLLGKQRMGSKDAQILKITFKESHHGRGHNLLDKGLQIMG
jgi:hypothetical protein